MTISPEDLLSLLPEIAVQARSVLGNLRLAEKQAVPEELREQDPVIDEKAAVMDQSYYRLLRLVENLSTLTALSAPPSNMALRDRDLVNVVGELCEKAADLTYPLDRRLRFVCPHETLICAVDQTALEDTLLYLLSNAFALTPQGGEITVELRKRGKQIQLSVRDGGMSISPNQMDALTTPGAEVPVQLQGISLNLLLCRGLAERQGGSLMGESLPKGGNRFTFSLPDRVCGNISEPAWDLTGGVGRILTGLSGILPREAFLIRCQDGY